jgi:hypothetical protein
VPFSSLARDPFSFDSPTLSAVAAVGRRLTPGDAAALFAAAGLAGALAAVALRRRPRALAATAIVLSFLVGAVAYSGDRRMTRNVLRSLAPAQPDWLQRSGVADADVLALPGGSLHSGWILESWNRNVGRTLHLGDVPPDPLPYTQVGIRPDGTLASSASPIESDHLVVDDSGTQVELDAPLVARPRPGLALYRTAGPVRLRSAAFGLYSDGWARSVLRYAAFPGRRTAGAYRVSLELPRGHLPRRVELEAGPVRRSLTLRPGMAVAVRIPAAGHPLPELAVRADRADFVGANTPRPRLVAVRVRTLVFEPEKRSRK